MQTTAIRTVANPLPENEIILLTLLISKRYIPYTDLLKFFCCRPLSFVLHAPSFFSIPSPVCFHPTGSENPEYRAFASETYLLPYIFCRYARFVQLHAFLVAKLLSLASAPFSFSESSLSS